MRVKILLGTLVGFLGLLSAQNQVLTKVNGGASWETGSGRIYSGDGTTPAYVRCSITDTIDFDGGTLLIDAVGNRVGIGTDVPLSRLEVKSATVASNDTTLMISNATGNVDVGDVVGGISFHTNDLSIWGSDKCASIEIEATHNYNGSGRPSSMNFYTNSTYGPDGAIKRMTINQDGAVSINTLNATAYLNVGKSSTTGTYTTAGWQHSSDRRLKDDIIGIEDPLSIIHKLNGVYYYWKEDRDAGRQIGFVAQDVQKVLPEVVGGKEGDIEKGETLSMAYQNMVPLLLEAIKELDQKNKLLEERITELESNKNKEIMGLR
jgi:hypothetical protein